MRRFFKILEKIVWALVAVAIIIVLILLAIGIITNYDVAANYISSLLPYFYLVAAVFFGIRSLNLWDEDVFGFKD